MRIHLHACDNSMDCANGDEILAPSDAIDVCASKHQSALIGGDGDFFSIRRAKGPRIGLQQMSESHCLCKQTTSSERKVKAVVHFSERRASSDLCMAGGAKRHSEKACNGGPNRPIAWTIPLPMHWNLIHNTTSFAILGY